MEFEEASGEFRQLRAAQVLAQAHKVEQVDGVAAVAAQASGDQVVGSAGSSAAGGHDVRQAALAADREADLVDAAAQAPRAHGPQAVESFEELLFERLAQSGVQALTAPVRVQDVPAGV